MESNKELTNEVTTADNGNRTYNRNGFNKKPFNKKVKGLPPITEKFPEHIVNLASLVKHNAEIRRFTALGIINYLKQKGEITGTSNFIRFSWEKFAVINNGLIREYKYTEDFFIKALIASFTSFCASAEIIISKFLSTEENVGIKDIITDEEIQKIAKDNLNHKNDKDIVSVDDNED